MRTKKILSVRNIIIALIILIILFSSSVVNFLVNIKWYSEVGYLNVYFISLFTKFKLGIPIFILLFLVFYIYLQFLKNEYIKHGTIIYSKDQIKAINGKLILAAVIISLLASVVVSSSYWQDILKFINGVSFNFQDPLYNRDISFYMFRLPLYKALYNLAFSITGLFFAFTLLFYIFITIQGETGGVSGNVYRMNVRKSGSFMTDIIENGGRKLAFFGLLVFLMIGAGFIIKNYNLVYSPRGVAFGASYTDVNVTLIFNRVMIGLSIIAGISIFYALFKKKFKMFIWIISLMVGAFIIQVSAEVIVERFIVAPNTAEKEKEYIDYNIKYTRAAYGLDKVEEKDFPSGQSLTAADIEKNKATIDNIRVNDFMPALDVYNQMQGIKQYYRFNDIDIDRYNINGKYTQVFISPRELDKSKLQGIPWQLKHLYYTHGYGIAMSPVNTITAEGQPSLIIKDIPTISTVDIKVDRPEIYFGELTDDYVITNTKIKELDYPSSGNNNVESEYQGKAGISLGGLNRLLFAINKGSLNFLLSQDLNSQSRIILNRSIMERVEKIAPFFVYDSDPYLVTNGGKLYWIIDAYTTSSLYPYSEPVNGINYIRNSVKVIIDAYDGTTNFYIIDENDPIAAAYNSIFPGLLKDSSKIPEGFKEHFRYPEGIFNIQLEAYKKYHMTNPKVFYNKEDIWSAAGESQGVDQAGERVEPSYIVMKLPEGTDEEFILMNSYTPPGKDNMAAWLGARMDGENYGRLIVYKFAKDKVTYGPSQFKARVNQDTTISKELSLWNQQGSQVMLGTVITIPIEKSLLYVMPVYIKSTGTNSIPEMKRVVLGYGDEIVMEETLGEALSGMFGLKQPEVKPAEPQDNPPVQDVGIQSLISKANETFIKAKEAQQRGDWAEYGVQLKELEELLKQLDVSSKEDSAQK